MLTMQPRRPSASDPALVASWWPLRPFGRSEIQDQRKRPGAAVVAPWASGREILAGAGLLQLPGRSPASSRCRHARPAPQIRRSWYPGGRCSLFGCLRSRIRGSAQAWPWRLSGPHGGDPRRSWTTAAAGKITGKLTMQARTPSASDPALVVSWWPLRPFGRSEVQDQGPRQGVAVAALWAPAREILAGAGPL